MNAVILVFSPSGNTNQVGLLIKSQLQKKNVNVQLINLSGDPGYFSANNKKRYLQEIVPEHDILFIGSPVYAHHLQYHVKDLIQNLPKPTNGWGKIVVPYVTYGGINSGIALEEAGKLLRKSGRKVLAGLKVSSSHCMTRAFMDEEFNKDQPIDKTLSAIKSLVEKLICLNLNEVKDQSKKLTYQNRKLYLKANIIFKEKEWHKKRYPKVIIDDDKCIKCGRCINVCPVLHLNQDNKKNVIKDEKHPCIHCFNCVLECPNKAISLLGDVEKAKSFMANMINKGKENPETCIYPNTSN